MLTDNILDLIGNTPLVRLRGENIYAKAEFLNPGGSIKDRVALAMIEGAERDGKLRPDSIIVEPTSGNTGIGVAPGRQAQGVRGPHRHARGDERGAQEAHPRPGG